MNLVQFAEEVTSKTVVVHNWRWVQSEFEIIVPKGTGSNPDPEALLHEVCHWIVALPIERKGPNLMLCGEDYWAFDVWDPETEEIRIADSQDARRSVVRERQAVFLEYWTLDRTEGFEAEDVDRLCRSHHPIGSASWYRGLSDRQHAARRGIVCKRARQAEIDLDDLGASFAETMDQIDQPDSVDPEHRRERHGYPRRNRRAKH